jgi:hypothetical protein
MIRNYTTAKTYPDCHLTIDSTFLDGANSCDVYVRYGLGPIPGENSNL